MITTIDGPAASGKSTVAANLAKRLGVAYLDSGAMYRALTREALDNGLDLSNADALVHLARSAHIDPDGLDPDNFRISVNGRDMTEAIRENRVSVNAHYAAQNPEIRKLVVAQQRKYAANVGALVSEGRDQGTIAFPDADVKFYLDGRPEVRARRRQLQLEKAGEYVPFRQVFSEMLERDRRDTQRKVSPLRCPDDAIRVDTSDMTVDEVVERLFKEVLSHTQKDATQGAEAG